MKKQSIVTALILFLLASCCERKDDHAKILFEDSMEAGWESNWFLDGRLATVRHQDDGLFFSGGTITKEMDPEAYHAHHAVLWTRQIFAGDLRISYDVTRIDNSDYGTTLLYLQAQGIGSKNHPADISKWNAQRKIPAMDKYFTKMNLISLSFRENLRCKRYPWKDASGEWYPQKGLIDPKVEYSVMIPGKTYHVEVQKKGAFVHLILSDSESGNTLVDHTWDTTKTPSAQNPEIITKGRIGLRHMSTKQMLYRNFKVEQL